MAIRLPSAAKHILRRSALTANKKSSTSLDAPKGFVPVYVGESQKKRFLVPLSFLSQPLFQDLLSKAEEEFGLIIQREVSQFHAMKMNFWTLLLA